jgi:hypothetical protein
VGLGYCPTMSIRGGTTLTTIAVAATLLAAACTTDSGSPAATQDRATVQPVPAAQVALPAAATTVATGRTAGEVAASVSRSLFRAAPVAVVALGGDESAVSTGATEAEKRGLPLLVADAAPAATATGTTAPAAPLGVVDKELTRLGTRTVLALGTGLADRLAASGTTVVTDPAELPPTSRPQPLAGVTVLVSKAAGPGPTAAAAAAATGTAAGADVVTVAGTDPRADQAAITALAAAKPTHVIAAGTAFGSVPALAARVATAATGVQLPGGGQVLFPGRRLIALYGHPGSAALGVLGEQPVAQAVARAKQTAAPYRALSGSTPVVPAFELIATVAQANPGPGGDYSYEAPVSLLKPWVDAADKAGLYVVLDLQPGRANFLDQAKLYEPLLRNPHVGLALDPEWRLAPGQLPLTAVGSAKASEINSVYRWLADLTAKYTLPQKLFVIHEFRLSMIGSDEPLEHDRDQVQLLVHMDGQGPTGNKDETWAAVVGAAPKGVPFGWKNFYDEDSPMLTPAQTMTRKPTPSMISYQ